MAMRNALSPHVIGLLQKLSTAAWEEEWRTQTVKEHVSELLNGKLGTPNDVK
jgi:hypothetical protein